MTAFTQRGSFFYDIKSVLKEKGKWWENERKFQWTNRKNSAHTQYTLLYRNTWNVAGEEEEGRTTAAYFSFKYFHFVCTQYVRRTTAARVKNTRNTADVVWCAQLIPAFMCFSFLIPAAGRLCRNQSARLTLSNWCNGSTALLHYTYIHIYTPTSRPAHFLPFFFLLFSVFPAYSLFKRKMGEMSEGRAKMHFR